MTYKELAESYDDISYLKRQIDAIQSMIDDSYDDLAVERYELEHSPLVYPEDVDAEMQEIRERIDASVGKMEKKIVGYENELSFLTCDDPLLMRHIENIILGDVFSRKAIKQLGEEYGEHEISEQILKMLGDFKNHLMYLDMKYWPTDGSEPCCREDLKLPDKMPEIEAIKDSIEKKQERVSVSKLIREKSDIISQNQKNMKKYGKGRAESSVHCRESR